MSDLSRLLGDVYQAETAIDEPVTDTTPTRLPEWADDEVLDKAFASWVPGPPDDAPAAERSMLTDLAVDRTAWAEDSPAGPAPAPAAAREPEAVEHVPDPEPVAVDRPAPPSGSWRRSDDDILVGGARKSFFRRSR